MNKSLIGVRIDVNSFEGQWRRRQSVHREKDTQKRSGGRGEEGRKRETRRECAELFSGFVGRGDESHSSKIAGNVEVKRMEHYV